MQDAERELCATLNTLAMRLLDKAEVGPGRTSGSAAKGKGKARAPAQPPAAPAADDEGGSAGEEDDAEDADYGSRPAKRARRSKGGGEAPSREALHARAQGLLEQSFRVAEKGIAGRWGVVAGGGRVGGAPPLLLLLTTA